MTTEQKEEILNEIRKIHGITMPEKDPAFAVITALEIVASRYLKEVDLLMVQQSANYETTTVRYLDKAKELAEIKISAAVDDVLIRMDEYKIKAIEEMKIETPKAEVPSIYWYLLSISVLSALGFGYAISMLIFT